MRRKPALAIALVSVTAISAHMDTASAQRPPRIRAVEVGPASAQIRVGQRQPFVCTAYDIANNPVAFATFVFTSSNRNIASIDDNGIAQGISAGTAIITARTGTGASAKSATAVLTVLAATEVVRAGIAASRTRLGLGVGERYPVTVMLVDERRQPIGRASQLHWWSNADSVARIVNGQILGVGLGRARLTGATEWDSTLQLDVFVVGQMLAPMQRGGRWDLYSFDAISNPRFVPITADVAVEQDPAWSPDLTRIAYAAQPADRPTSFELFVANADGSEAHRLTYDSATVASPVFVRPAGEQLVFQSNKGGAPHLYVINRDGSGRRPLSASPNPSSQPDVSPDGRRVLFASLRMMPGSPRNYDVWEVNLDGTGERRLTTSPRNEDSPRYAPDGRSFYYLRDEGRGTKRVYRQGLADMTAVTAQPITPQGVFVRAYSVSADGRLLVLSEIEDVPGRGGIVRAVLVDPSTGTSLPIRVGADEQLAQPVFRPATPPPR